MAPRRPAPAYAGAPTTPPQIGQCPSASLSGVVTAWDQQAGSGRVFTAPDGRERAFYRRALPADHKWASARILRGSLATVGCSDDSLATTVRPRWQPGPGRAWTYGFLRPNLGTKHFLRSSALFSRLRPMVRARIAQPGSWEAAACLLEFDAAGRLQVVQVIQHYRAEWDGPPPLRQREAPVVATAGTWARDPRLLLPTRPPGVHTRALPRRAGPLPAASPLAPARRALPLPCPTGRLAPPPRIPRRDERADPPLRATGLAV